jgi:hypothetical protein
MDGERYVKPKPKLIDVGQVNDRVVNLRLSSGETVYQKADSISTLLRRRQRVEIT